MAADPTSRYGQYVLGGRQGTWGPLSFLHPNNLIDLVHTGILRQTVEGDPSFPNVAQARQVSLDYNELLNAYQAQTLEYDRLIGIERQDNQELHAAYKHNMQELFKSQYQQQQQYQGYQKTIGQYQKQGRSRLSPLSGVMNQLLLMGNEGSEGQVNPYQNMFGNMLRGIQQSSMDPWNDVLQNEKP